jgi:hypothetical protein
VSVGSELAPFDISSTGELGDIMMVAAAVGRRKRW